MVIPFTDSTFSQALVNSYTGESAVRSKNHFTYLLAYLKEIKAKSMVVEAEYISRDYLHDYASYYSLCFEKYPKFCKRIHFFSAEFSEQEFKAILLNKDEVASAEFWKQYLGFIVVKPIPVMVLGYSLLQTYNGDVSHNERTFWGLKKHTIHIFGREVTITSLAFQEQDKVLAACATTAIWSMLNKISGNHFPMLRSPSQITQDADRLSSDGSRLFPNKGLSIWQICQAITGSGLVCEVKQADIAVPATLETKVTKVFTNHLLKQILWAYSGIGIPIILVVQVPTPKGYRSHAITVCGHNLGTSSVVSKKGENIRLHSCQVDKIYAHDDQWGPFVRVTFLNGNAISTPWTERDEENRPTFVNGAIVSLYPKIRISYEDIKALAIGFNVVFSSIIKAIVPALKGKIESYPELSEDVELLWDIRIKYADQYKKEIHESTLSDDIKLPFLLQSLPKYVWVAKCSWGEKQFVDCVFDATNVADAMIGLKVLPFIPFLNPLISKLLESKTRVEPAIGHILAGEYAEFLRSQFSEKGTEPQEAAL